VQLLLVILLLLLHLFTEKYSLTAVIAGNRLLSFIDRLGRGRPEEEKR
jgi:UDP-GlcNAc:undecaprenyl-phosphate GlcNAc-1-phosphate transferase